MSHRLRGPLGGFPLLQQRGNQHECHSDRLEASVAVQLKEYPDRRASPRCPVRYAQATGLPAEIRDACGRPSTADSPACRAGVAASTTQSGYSRAVSLLLAADSQLPRRPVRLACDLDATSGAQVRIRSAQPTGPHPLRPPAAQRTPTHTQRTYPEGRRSRGWDDTGQPMRQLACCLVAHRAREAERVTPRIQLSYPACQHGQVGLRSPPGRHQAEFVQAGKLVKSEIVEVRQPCRGLRDGECEKL